MLFFIYNESMSFYICFRLSIYCMLAQEMIIQNTFFTTKYFILKPYIQFIIITTIMIQTNIYRTFQLPGLLGQTSLHNHNLTFTELF